MFFFRSNGSESEMEESARPCLTFREFFDSISAVEHATLTARAAELGTEPPSAIIARAAAEAQRQQEERSLQAPRQDYAAAIQRLLFLIASILLYCSLAVVASFISKLHCFFFWHIVHALWPIWAPNPLWSCSACLVIPSLGKCDTSKQSTPSVLIFMSLGQSLVVVF